jgi:signal transduction histidine kinase
LLMAAIGRFAASNWAAMNAGLEREGLLLREQERARERLEAVLDVAQSILEGRPVQEFTRLVALRARSLAGADVAAVAIPDSTNRTFTFEMVEGNAANGLLGLQVTADDSGLGALLSTDSPVILDNLSQANGPGSTALAGMGAALLMPLAAGSRRFGTLMLANLAGARQFTEQDRTLIELFAVQVAVALEYARIRDELRRLVLIEDRERISRELHDGVIQSLFAIGIELESAMSADPAQREAVQRSIREINGVIRDLRAYIYGLVPGLLHDSDLEGALARLAEDFRTRLKLSVSTQINSAVAQLLAARSLDIIQFTTEALSNVARHSGSSTCTMTLDRSGDQAAFEIRDEGRGFDPSAATGRGLGLSSLRHRAARLGGELKIDAAVGVGAAVRLIIPLVETDADHVEPASRVWRAR